MIKIKSGILKYAVVMLLFCAASDRPKLVKVKVNDWITVYLPKEWRPMDNLDIAQRYPSVRAPIAAYTNEERLADFSINVSATQWPDQDVLIATKFFKAGLMNMFDRVEIIDEGIRESHGHKFIYFEFDSRINGNRQTEGLADPVLRYTYIQYLLGSDRAIVFSFSCPRRQKEIYQETAREMMLKLRVK
jgi:hypothetical protein